MIEKYFILFLAIIIISVISSNPILTLVSLVSLFILVKLTYRKGFTVVFAFMVTWQWLEITIKVLYADLLFIPVSQLIDTNSYDESVIYSLLGLTALSSGIFLLTKNLPAISIEKLRNETRCFSEKKLFILWIVFSFFNSFISGIMFKFMSLQQIFAGLLNIKMVIVASLLFVSFLNNRDKRYVYFVIATELLLGFTGYFSGFKTIIFYLIIITVTIYPKLNIRVSFRYAVVFGLLFVFAIAWILIRNDYRNYLNGGSGMQVVEVTMSKRLDYLTNLISNIDFANAGQGIEQTINRVSYSDFLAEVMDRVPAYVSYQNGNLFLETLKSIFMPRLLFPQKKILDDSEITNAYTGRNYSGASKGTSIGIGYMAYYYIDFGKNIMLIFIFLQGLLYGLVYKYFVKKLDTEFLVYSVTLPLLMGVYLYETSQPKIIEGLISSSIIMAVSVKYFLRYFISYVRIYND